MEQTFIAVKPDGVQRGLCGEIIKRFETRGYKLVAAKFVQSSEEHMKNHYADLKDMPFYAGLCKYMSSGPVFAMVWEGQSIVKLARMMLGETNPADSKPGSIRGDLGSNMRQEHHPRQRHPGERQA
ncbi:nucleoside diphosphate kinase B-like isoform X1 [Gymnodraco acuticeps]|uniref:Nucleoside diphosphate kinase B n=1 Tax=Gymnodraco acuticeps TaxID=8218 RepID=A0A6P8U6S6_GYMAC|nr:nucleoside diphosphate kinase B-like isoform X1 [Gymnodraco acuticeps]